MQSIVQKYVKLGISVVKVLIKVNIMMDLIILNYVSSLRVGNVMLGCLYITRL